MMAEQQQFATLLNKVKALIVVVQNLHEVVTNNQQWPVELAAPTITSKYNQQSSPRESWHQQTIRHSLYQHSPNQQSPIWWNPPWCLEHNRLEGSRCKEKSPRSLPKSLREDSSIPEITRQDRETSRYDDCERKFQKLKQQLVELDDNRGIDEQFGYNSWSPLFRWIMKEVIPPYIKIS